LKYIKHTFCSIVFATSLLLCTTVSAMDDSEFWTLISLIDIKKLDEGDEDTALQKLTDVLASKSEAEIGAFEEMLSQKLYNIDGRKWINQAGESSNSDDGFLYARCYVVAKGKKYYQEVLSKPSLMPKSSDQWAESMLYITMKAWTTLTGKNEEQFTLYASVSSETGSNTDQW